MSRTRPLTLLAFPLLGKRLNVGRITLAALLEYVVALLVLSSSVLAQDRVGPSLSETIKFAEDNVADGTLKASCASVEYVYVRLDWKHSFNIRDVVATVNSFKEYDFVEQNMKLQCISGNCMSTTGMGDKKTSVVSIATSVPAHRVVQAMLHLQKLCGGPARPAF